MACSIWAWLPPGVQIPSLRCHPRAGEVVSFAHLPCLILAPITTSGLLASQKCLCSTQFGVFLDSFSIAFFFFFFCLSHLSLWLAHIHAHVCAHSHTIRGLVSLYSAGPSPNTALGTPLSNFARSDSHLPGFVLPTSNFPCLRQPSFSEGEENAGWVRLCIPALAGTTIHPRWPGTFSACDCCS